MGLARTTLRKVPPHPPIATGEPFPHATDIPSPPSPLLFPAPPWLFLQCSWRGRPRLVWGRGSGGRGGGPSKRHLGPDPHVGDTRYGAAQVLTIPRARNTRGAYPWILRVYRTNLCLLLLFRSCCRLISMDNGQIQSKAPKRGPANRILP